MKNYRILEIYNKNPRVNNIKFSVGQTVLLEELEKYSEEKVMAIEYTRIRNKIVEIRIYDYYNNLIIRAEAL